MKLIHIDHKTIGGNFPCFIVAEVGINHNGNAELAWKTILAAHESGVDAVKLQNFTTSAFVHREAPNYEFLRTCELNREEIAELIEKARKCGITVFSTPESIGDLEFLDRMGVPAIKIASMDINYEALIRSASRFQRPIVLSTGMSYLYEVANAINWVEREGNNQLVVLHCTSCYPTPPEQVNLAAMGKLQASFDYPVGYSDHTIGIEVGVSAAGMGACMLEKHFTIDKTLPGPDHCGSADSDDMKRMISWIRTREKTIGLSDKIPVECEKDARLKKRRSIYAAVDLPAGACLHEEDVSLLTPSSPDSQLEDLAFFLGRPLNKKLKKGALITHNDF